MQSNQHIIKSPACRNELFLNKKKKLSESGYYSVYDHDPEVLFLVFEMIW